MRDGVDSRIPHSMGGHTLLSVYSEMLAQICLDYPGLPDPRTLTLTEIRFFYEMNRASLKKATKQREKK